MLLTPMLRNAWSGDGKQGMTSWIYAAYENGRRPRGGRLVRLPLSSLGFSFRPSAGTGVAAIHGQRRVPACPP